MLKLNVFLLFYVISHDKCLLEVILLSTKNKIIRTTNYLYLNYNLFLKLILNLYMDQVNI